MEITNAGFIFDSFDEPVDRITIPLTSNLQADSVYTDSMTYYGECGRAQLTVRIRITSNCPANTYGPLCSTACEDVANQRSCNYLGTATCAPNYYPANSCTTFCVPRDDNSGHYTCNSDGTIMCNTGYTDTSTNCVTCTGNFKEPDCTECDDDYYPRGTCNVYCAPTDNENGHYTCESSGNKRCLTGYTDTSTNCVMCVGNYVEPDCVLCDDKFQGPGCESCIEHYYISSQNLQHKVRAKRR